VTRPQRSKGLAFRMTRVNVGITNADYEWVLQHPGLQFSAILAKAIHQLREHEKAQFAIDQTQRDTARTAMGAIR